MRGVRGDVYRWLGEGEGMPNDLKPHVQRLARAAARNALLRGQLLRKRIRAHSPKNELEGFLFDFFAELRHELRERAR